MSLKEQAIANGKFGYFADPINEVCDIIEEFTRETCVWTRSGIDLGGEQKIYATACNKEWPYMSVPPHKCRVSVCHGCGKRIVEEIPAQ